MTAREVVRKMNSDQGKLNRANGEAFEYRVLRKYKNRLDVCFAIRSAGSHSAVDVLVQFKNGKQYWITCKMNGYLTDVERSQLAWLAKYQPKNVSVIMVYYKSAKKMASRRLY